MTQGQKNFPTKAAIKRGCLAHDRHTHLTFGQYTALGHQIQSRSNMATANYYDQSSDYVSKILTEKRKVGLDFTSVTRDSYDVFNHFSPFYIMVTDV